MLLGLTCTLATAKAGVKAAWRYLLPQHGTFGSVQAESQRLCRVFDQMYHAETYFLTGNIHVKTATLTKT